MCPCREQTTYKLAAIVASSGVTAMAISAVYFRFSWHMQNGSEFPMLEAAATLLLTFGGVVRPISFIEYYVELSASDALMLFTSFHFM